MCYFAAPRKLKNAVLFVFSLIFYGWGEPRYIVLMIVSIVSGFVFALMIEKKQNKKSGLILMWISVAVSLSFLLIFKYADFLIENVNQLPGVSLPLSKLSLPIGISFYTFQIISYTVDVWRGDTKAQRNIISFGTYVSLFPQLIAGPIVRYTDIERELQERKHSVTLAASGISDFDRIKQEGTDCKCTGRTDRYLSKNIAAKHIILVDVCSSACTSNLF